MITYQTEDTLSVQSFKELLDKSTLGLRRPVNDPDRLAAMLAHANLIITARDKGQLIGVARSLTDFAFAPIFQTWRSTKDTRNRESGGS
jgi:hypothetical protein